MTGTCDNCGRTVEARTLSGQLIWFDSDNDSRCDDYEPHTCIAGAERERAVSARTIVTHDDVPVHVAGDTAAALLWLQRHQGQSFDYALKHGGYALIQADQWAEKEARQHSSSAREIFAEPWHTRGHDGENDELTRENCAACVLEGFGEDPEELGPNHGSWARIYVEARRPIPARWKRAFVAEFADSAENVAYRDALRRSVATFGVMFA